MTWGGSTANYQRKNEHHARAISSSRPYVGVTSALYERMIDHRTGVFEGFTKKYGIKTLVYYEFLPTMPDAIGREKRLKKWNRAWKIRLIDQMNPTWSDLFDPERGILQFGPGGQQPNDRT